MSCDILNIEWSSAGRDVDIVEPVLSSLELGAGLRIARESIADWEWKLLKLRPRMLLISNTIGAPENFHLVKTASKLGIRVVSLISEGDYPDLESSVLVTFWGWNRDKILYEDLHLEWSQRNIDLIRKAAPATPADAIALSGATGFDRYKLLAFQDKPTLLGRHGKSSYRKVVALIGWGFDHFFGDYWAKFEPVLRDSFSEREVVLFRDSLARMRSIYDGLIAAHPDVLFILKHHPGVVDTTYSEFRDLDRHPNTLDIRRQENIADVLSAADFAIAFDSTTALEAWLLGKPTLLINPCGADFLRSKLSRGSPIVADLAAAEAALASFYAAGELPGFRELEGERQRLIAGTIGWSDGKNHLRARDAVLALWRRPGRKPMRLDGYALRQLVLGLSKSLLRRLPLLRSLLKSKLVHLDRFDTLFSRAQREQAVARYREALKSFYAVHGDKADEGP